MRLGKLFSLFMDQQRLYLILFELYAAGSVKTYDNRNILFFSMAIHDARTFAKSYCFIHLERMYHVLF